MFAQLYGNFWGIGLYYTARHYRMFMVRSLADQNFQPSKKGGGSFLSAQRTKTLNLIFDSNLQVLNSSKNLFKLRETLGQRGQGARELPPHSASSLHRCSIFGQYWMYFHHCSCLGKACQPVHFGSSAVPVVIQSWLTMADADRWPRPTGFVLQVLHWLVV